MCVCVWYGVLITLLTAVYNLSASHISKDPRTNRQRRQKKGMLLLSTVNAAIFMHLGNSHPFGLYVNNLLQCIPLNSTALKLKLSLLT